MRVDDEIKHQICLPLIGGVGDIIAKKLLINFGTAKAVFCAKKKELEKEMQQGLIWNYQKVNKTYLIFYKIMKCILMQ